MMANKRSRLPFNTAQNPAPVKETGQQFQQNRHDLVNEIMKVFLSVLPSNYVSTVNGPFYTIQYQAIAEQLAAIQLSAQEINKDADWDFTRPEFLFETIGTLVFPDATERSGYPRIEGDIPYREFLQSMVLLLLQGATKATVEEGAGLLTDAVALVVERYLSAADRVPGGLWDIDNQFEFDLFLDGDNAFPDNPFINQDNLALIIDALKAAHAIYQLTHLFQETFDALVDDSGGFGSGDDERGYFWNLFSYYYDDFRKFCYGIKKLSGTGDTGTDRTYFTDTDLSFGTVSAGATLTILSGVNAGRYTVTDVRYIYIDDSTPRAFTTSPTGLSGTATVSGSDITADVDLSTAVEGEVLTFASGPNAGSYRLDTFLGQYGGPIATTTPAGAVTSVRLSPCILKLDRRVPQANVTGQTYEVTVDRLGVKTYKLRTGEDVSNQFWL